MSFFFAKTNRLKHSAGPATLALLLGGCASTTLTSQANISGADPMNYTDFVTLPVEVVGQTPMHSQADIAALFPAYHAGSDDSSRHVVIYVNPGQVASVSTLCSSPSSFQQGTQVGESANVTGALCDGSQVVTTATGRVRTVVPNAKWLMRDFAIVRDQLYQSLTPNLTPRYP